ncbi:MAG: tetratricopeptide repeat protein [Blastocatellia bacterium]|nr:tetratricopeptide repeat protein [Blastocatellia bacterium]
MRNENAHFEQQDATVSTLKQGDRLEREVKAGEVQTYQIPLSAGDYVQALVEQRSVNIALTLFGPDRKKLAEIDYQKFRQGIERLYWVANLPGNFELEVRSLEKEAGGVYEIRLAELRTASNTDRLQVQALQLYWEGSRLGTQRDAESQSKPIETYQHAAKLFKEAGDKSGEGAALHRIGRMYSETHQSQKALAYFDQAIPLYILAGDRQGEGSALIDKGTLYGDDGNAELFDVAKASELYERALPIARAIGDKELEARTIFNTAKLYGRPSGDWRKAIDLYHSAVAPGRASGNLKIVAGALNNMGMAYFDSGEPYKALEIFDQALTTVRSLGDRQNEAGYLHNIAMALYSVGDVQKSLDVLDGAEAIVRTEKLSFIEPYTRHLKGLMFSALGEHERAIESYQQGLLLARQFGMRNGERSFLMNIGEAQLRAGDVIANDGTAESFFGQLVAISGDTAIVGALVNNGNNGLFYVFVRSGNTWTQQAKLIPSDGVAVNFHSGLRAAISGDRVVINGPAATINSNINQGAAYVFVRNGTTWTEQQRLTASDGAAEDQFGSVVSIDGDSIVVGAVRDDVGSNTDQGSAYVYIRQGAVWTEQAKLVANDGAANGLLGSKVSISGDTVAVSTGVFSPSSVSKAYVFFRSGTSWSQQANVSVCGPHNPNSPCGIQSVAVNGDTFIFGDIGVNVGNNTFQGAAYVFIRSGTTWSQQQRLTASDGKTDDSFGFSAIEGNTIVVGARDSAYVFTRSGNVWTEQQKLQLSRANSMAFSGNTILLGVPGETINGNTNQGSVYVFVSPTSTPSVIQFDATNYPAAENIGSVPIVVTRAGDTSGIASVGYATSDSAGLNNCNVLNTGVASSRCDYETTVGTLHFAAGETSKTISIPLIDDSYAEGNESFVATLSNATGATLGSPTTATITINDNDATTGTNPIDQAGSFVRQHYIDFLNREPDGSGLAFWSDQITSCGTDTACTEIRRINVSAAFFLSIEFQETGYLVERLYKASYGKGAGTSTFGGTHQLAVPIVRLIEFLPDTQQIGRGVVVGEPGWETVLENNKQAFTAEFVQRLRFTTAFPTSMIAAQFVDTLNANADNPLSQSERDQLVNSLTSGAMTRAQVLRAVAEDPDLKSAEFNRAFVLMQYFGYLRRNPNDTPDSDYSGYDFWLTKLNQFNGNFVNAEMVKAFIVSGEYRQRFGP